MIGPPPDGGPRPGPTPAVQPTTTSPAPPGPSTEPRPRVRQVEASPDLAAEWLAWANEYGLRLSGRLERRLRAYDVGWFADHSDPFEEVG
jgi:hypothetical protein